MIEGLAVGITLAIILIATIEHFEKKPVGPVDDDLRITEATHYIEWRIEETWKK